MSKSLREAFNNSHFVVTAEAGPVKGTDTSRMTEHINLLKEKVCALNATDNQSSVMRYPSVGSCLLIKELGGEPVLQVTCRDRNRLAIQSDLLFAWSRGISNVLCLTGDSVDVGDHKTAKQVFDLDSVQLIRLVHVLNSGKDLMGNDLVGNTGFFVGTSACPSFDPIEVHLLKIQKKIEAGLDFIQTQAIYSIDDLKRFMEYVRKMDTDVKVLAGIVPLTGTAMAKYLNSNVPGIFVPDQVINEIAQAPRGQGPAKGIEIAVRTIRQIAAEKICDGVHIMYIGREDRIPGILEAAGLL